MDQIDTQPRAVHGPPRFGDVVLRSPRNWTAVIFFAFLATVHYAIASISFFHGHWEGYMSLFFGLLFTLVSIGSAHFRFELAIAPSRRRIRLRHGIGRFCMERIVGFDEIQGVRLTLCGSERNAQSRIELLCVNSNDIECPTTAIPRQEALFLAMALDVPLQKVSEGDFPDARSAACDSLPSERV